MRAAGRGFVTTKMADISLNAALTRPIFVARHMASAAVMQAMLTLRRVDGFFFAGGGASAVCSCFRSALTGKPS